MTAYLLFPAFLVAAALGFTAVVAVVGGTRKADPVMSQTDAELDALIAEGLRDWGKGGVA